MEATLAGPRPKPTMSRFKADRLTSSYGMRPPRTSQSSDSISLASSVIPVSGQQLLRHSIRMGKLVNDQLIGGEEGESDIEDEKILG